MTTQPDLYRRLAHWMEILAGSCDGASSLDGAGFNRMDTDFGHVLAETAPTRWSPKMAGIAHRFAVKYRRQLATAGIDAEQIPKPEAGGQPARHSESRHDIARRLVENSGNGARHHTSDRDSDGGRKCRKTANNITSYFVCWLSRLERYRSVSGIRSIHTTCSTSRDAFVC